MRKLDEYLSERVNALIADNKGRKNKKKGRTQSTENLATAAEQKTNKNNSA